MNDRYIDGGASLIRLYGWLRETGEIDRLIDLVIEKVRDSRLTEKAKDPEPTLRAENERLSRIEAAARELFRSLDYVAPGWRDETCSLGAGSDEVNRAWATLEHVLIAPAALAAPPEEK